MAQLSINDVRQEIMSASGYSRAPGAASTSAVGGLFHQVLAGLMGPHGWQAALEPDEWNDTPRLLSHTYEKLLGPRITASQASLRESGAEILDLWKATESMCAWLCRLLESASHAGLISYDPQSRAWQGVDSLCRPEHPLQWEFRQPHWTAPVLISGVADALWFDPVNKRWCVVEYKLGQGHPEADLAQACLYHAMLRESGLSPADGSLALFAFRPELREHFYTSAQLHAAQARLHDLIGRLAGVLPEQRPLAAARPPAPTANPSHADLGKQLVRTLAGYSVPVEWNGEVIAGPTFLRFPVMPGRNVKKRAITDKAGELQMQLRLEEPPFIHLAKGRLVIDVQRPDRQTVPFSSIASQLPAAPPAGSSSVPLGVDLTGTLQCVELASPNNPHLLVAGTAGSGKSEWLRAAIAGLICTNSPQTLRLVLIDPKRTAFTELKDSPYLYGNKGLVFPPDDPAIETLETLIEEMEDRYRHFSRESVSDLPEYLAKTGQQIPRIVCVCDEYADLISDRATKKEIEAAINRLGAKARAAGIHLIIATQYPDRNTVAGALKANLAGRVCLRTTSHIQSNMIINQSGAEKLLGKGDLFFLSIGEPVRLQAPFLTAEERARVFAAPQNRANFA